MRTKRIALNAVIEIFFYLIIGVLGIFKVKYIIEGLGSELNGYYQFINQIIAYLFLVEAGLGSAILYKLYKPMAINDHEGAAEVYNGSRVIFRWIGYLIIGLMVLIAIILYIYIGIKDQGISYSITVAFIILVISQLIPYFFFSKSYVSLLAAHQKSYIYSLIYNLIRVVTDCIIIYVIITYKSIIALAAVVFCLKIIEETVIYTVGKKLYPWLKCTSKKDTSAKNMTGDLVWHQIGTLIVNNVDSIILMTFIGPVIVSIYSTYNYVVFFLRELITRINHGIVHSLGNVFAKEKIDKSFKLFSEYHVLMTIIALSVSLTFNIGARAFVKVWINDFSYILDYYVVVIFSSTIFLNIIYRPLCSAISTNGLYKDSKYFALIISAVNLALSLVLLQVFGIAGILFATSVGFLVGIILRIRLINKRIFVNNHFNRIINKYVFGIVLFISGSFIFSYFEQFCLITINNIFQWVLIVGCSFIVLTIIIVCVFLLIDNNTKDILNKLIYIFNNRKQRQEA